MVANANPSGNQEGNKNSMNSFNSHNPSSYRLVNGGENPNNRKSVPAAEKYFRPKRGLKHFTAPGLSLEWTAEEQLILEKALIKYASEPHMDRYASIASELPNKMSRDIALRCRWMSEKAAHPSTNSASLVAGCPNVPPYALSMIPTENYNGISFKDIGGATGQMLEQNALVFNQISANLASNQFEENINLLCQTRDNILSILNDLNDMPGIIKQMPPIPVKINEELANSILPTTSLPMQQLQQQL